MSSWLRKIRGIFWSTKLLLPSQNVYSSTEFLNRKYCQENIPFVFSNVTEFVSPDIKTASLRPLTTNSDSPLNVVVA
jgi:hypothetical protein